MCNVICCLFVLVVAVFIGCSYLSQDNEEIWDCDDPEIPTGGGGEEEEERKATDCNPRRTSWSSCCSVNPIIQEQVTNLLAGAAGKCNNYGPGNCVCIPNIGSIYVGAAVASIRETVPYHHPLGLPTSKITNRPELTLEPSQLIIGKNWHFSGIGSLVVKLFQPSRISGFTVIHPRKCEIPKGFETSAPKDFHVLGLNDLDEKNPFQFGNFTYKLTGRSDQPFPVEFCSLQKFQFVEFRFTSNHGNPNYTALYKVQIHGDLETPLRYGLEPSTIQNPDEDDDND